MKRVALLIALAACGLVGTGCSGGRATAPLPKAEYERKMDDLGRQLSSSYVEIGVGLSSPTSAKRFAELFDKAAHLLRDAEEGFSRITPPPDIASQHARLIVASRELAGDIEGLAGRVRSGTVAVGPFDPTILASFREIQSAVQAIRAKGYALGGAA